MRRRPIAALLAVVLMVLAGCGKADGGGNPGAGPTVFKYRIDCVFEIGTFGGVPNSYGLVGRASLDSTTDSDVRLNVTYRWTFLSRSPIEATVHYLLKPRQHRDVHLTMPVKDRRVVELLNRGDFSGCNPTAKAE